ncbi:MAG: Hsp70 family protein [Planctomycetaceae bacterium]|nr:Hsp70 family protein [Planctomycetaceae bacterium]
METHGTVVGIDLGTTFSAIAYLNQAGIPITVPNAEGQLTTPSAILFDTEGGLVVGQEAKRASLIYPDRVAIWIKRDMGEKLYRQQIAGRWLSPSALSGIILKKMRKDAELRIGPISGAVVTVPAYFDEARRQATVDAGAIAGLKVLDIINEPTSAALAWGFRNFIERGGSARDVAGIRHSTHDQGVSLVYDLGGGTFDVTVIKSEGETLRVLATDGDVQLGGKDWDDVIVDYVSEQFIDKYGSDPRQDPQSHQDLQLASEDAKHALSRLMRTQMAVNHAGNRLMVELTRERFDEITSGLLFRTSRRVDRVLEQAELDWSGIDRILLVGGSTRMPQVVKMLREKSGQEPDHSLAADEVVAHGAAIHAAILQISGAKGLETTVTLPEDGDEGKSGSGETMVGRHIVLPDIGVEADGSADTAELPAIPRGADEAEIAQHALRYELKAAGGGDYEPQIAEALQGIKTINVSSHTLGVVATSPRSGRKIRSVLIPHNTELPVSASKTYGTVSDNQSVVRVRVIEGESDDPEACIHIGECVVSPLPHGLRKGSPITVTFTYDNSGRLHVQARDDTSGVMANTTIVRPGAMTSQQIDRAQSALDALAMI